MLSVIGAGFGRTGTNSLQVALQKLGYDRCYHMYEVDRNPGHAAEWSRAADGKEVDWDRLFHGYLATVDWPSTFFWRTLADLNPDAKVILTVRDPKDWYKSMTKTILKSLSAASDSKNGGPSSERLAMAKKMVLDGTFQGQVFDEAKAIQVFEDHNQKVADQLPRERLLVYEVREGWEPLCDFLSCEVPAESFPRTNVSK